MKFLIITTLLLAQVVSTNSVAAPKKPDTVAPRISSSIKGNTVTKNDKIKINVADKSTTTTQIYQNGILIQTGSSRSFDVILVEGPNVIVVKSIDEAGNQSEYSLPSIILDTQFPIISSTVSSGTLTNDNNLRIAISDVSPILSTKIYKNGKFVDLNTSFRSYDLILTEGLNHYWIKSTDQVNQTTDFYVTSVTLDTKPPVIASNVSSGAVVTNNKVRITITDLAAVSTEIFRDGVLIGTESAKSFDLTLSGGLNSFILQSKDAAQNEIEFPISNITLLLPDSAPPVISASVGSGIITNNNNISVSISDQSGVSTQVYRNGLLMSTQSSKSFNLQLIEGDNTFVLKAVDEAQNRAADFVLSNIVFDSIAPIISSSVSSGATVSNSKIQITITDSATVSTQVFQNGLLVKTVADKIFDLTLADGLNSFILKTTDAAGNKANDYVLLNITLDNSMPILTSSVQSGTITNNDKIQITILDSSPTVATQVYKEGILVSSTNLKSFLLSLSEGNNNFVLKSMDPSQNEAADFVLSNIVLDTAVPILSSNVNSGTTVTNNKIQISITDASSVITQVFKNGELIATESTIAFELTLTPGNNNFTLISIDEARNQTQFEINNVSFNIDDSAPPEILAYLQDAGIFTSREKVPVVINDNSTVITEVYKEGLLVSTETENKFEITLTEGLNNFKIVSTDKFGNSTTLELSNISFYIQAPKVFADPPGSTRFTRSTTIRIFTAGGPPGAPLELTLNNTFKFFAFVNLGGSSNVAVPLVEGLNTFELKFRSDIGYSNSLTFNIIRDTIAPIISAEIDPERPNLAIISIAEEYEVYSYIQKNGQFFAEHFGKTFNLDLESSTEDTFVIRTNDQAGNISELTLHGISSDVYPPEILAFTVGVGIFTTQPKVPISIVDESAVTTEVYKEGVLISTEQGKEFELTLVEGMNNFILKSIDAFGNQTELDLSNITLNTQIPQVTINPESGSITSRPYINIYSYGDTLYYLMQATINESITYTAVVNGGGATLMMPLFEGVNNLVVKLFDYSNNYTPAVLFTVFLDSVAPQISSSVDSNNGNLVRITIADQSPTVFTLIYKNNEIIYYQDSKSFDLDLESGSTYLLQAMDEAGNMSEFTLNGISVDSQAPQISSSVPSNGLTKFNTIQISIAESSLARTQVFQGGNLISTHDEKSFELPLIEGSNSFTLRSVDSYGNLSEDLVLYGIVLDSISPVITSDLNNQYQFNSLPQAVTINVSLSELVQNLSLNGQALIEVAPYTYSFTIEFDEYGTKNFNFIAVDLAGNESVVQQSVEVLLEQDSDTQAPVITSSVSSNAFTKNNKIQINITDASLARTQVLQNGELVSSHDEKSFEIPLAEGSNSFTLRSVDSKGNLSEDFVLLNITLDTIAPVISASNIPWNADEVEISITDTSSVVKTFIYVNGEQVFTQNEKKYNFYLDYDSEYTLKAIDQAGNMSSDLIVSRVNRGHEMNVPLISSSMSSSSFTKDNKVRINIIDESLVRTYVYRFQELIGTHEEKSFDLPLAQGYNYFTLISVDIHGNKSEYLVLSDVYSDQAAPVITSNIKNRYLYKSFPKSETFTINVDEPVQSISINGNAPILIGGLNYSYTVQFDEPGNYNFNIIAMDNLGNESVVQQTVEVLMDLSAPVITVGDIPVFVAAEYYDLNVLVSGDQNITTKIYVDGVEMSSTSEKDFIYRILFDSVQLMQTKVVKLVSTNANGDMAEKILAIVKNTTPLSVQIVSPVNASVVESREVLVQLVANKPLTMAKINGQIVSLQGDSMSVKAILIQPADGNFTATVEVTDISGATALSEVHAEVRTVRIPAWEYQECPIN